VYTTTLKTKEAYALCTFKQEDFPNVSLLRTIGLLDSVLARAYSESLGGGSTRVRQVNHSVAVALVCVK
jgi:hypothetical protein